VLGRVVLAARVLSPFKVSVLRTHSRGVNHMTDNAKIVEVAGLMLKLDQYKNEDDPACLEDSARFEQAVKGPISGRDDGR